MIPTNKRKRLFKYLRRFRALLRQTISFSSVPSARGSSIPIVSAPSSFPAWSSPSCRRTMPTFSAIAFDSLLEPGASGSVANTVSSEKSPTSRPPISKLESKGRPPREITVSRPQMSPGLSATPEPIPLPDPDPPSSFPPSPYIINHKSCGPRLLKSSSDVDVSLHQKTEDEVDTDGDVDVKVAALRMSTSVSFPSPEAIVEAHTNGVRASPSEKNNLIGIRDGPVLHQSGGAHDGELGSGKLELDSSNGGIEDNIAATDLERDTDLPEAVTAKADRDGESENFYDADESASFTSNTDVEDEAAPESSQKLSSTSAGEFYDARDELSSVDSEVPTSVNAFEADVRDVRLSLQMEIEKREQAEETLEQMRAHWERLREQLVEVGVSLPADPTSSADSKQHNMSVTEQLCFQLEVARLVSDSIGRDLTKAEVEKEMETKLEAKNSEIVRLSDRLHYYEAVNREMSQRNQEAIEAARRQRQRRKKRKRWIWGSISTTIAVGSAALAWAYLPVGKSSSGLTEPQPPMKDG